MTTLFSLILAAIQPGGPPAPPPAQDLRIAGLVLQLVDKSLQVREWVVRKLERRGCETASALATGIKNADPEVVNLCQALLSAVVAAARKASLEILVKDPTGPPPRNLAGLSRFLAITGDDKAARQLYAQMMTRHADVVEAMEKDPRAGSQLMCEFFDKAYERWQKSDDVSIAILADHGEAALFLFVRSDARFVIGRGHEDIGILGANKLRGALGGPEAVPAIKKLFLHWLSAEQELRVAESGFLRAVSEDLKEALPIALKIITDRNYPVDYRALMLGIVAEFGGRDQLRDLAPLLEDTESLGPHQFRDLALGASIRLAGEKLTDFLPANDAWFPDQAARDAAFAKWKAWTQRQNGQLKK